MNESAVPSQPSANSGVPQRVLLTPEEAAEALGIGRWKLYDLLRRGDLASIRIGSCRRIPASALEEFVTTLRRRQPTWET